MLTSFVKQNSYRQGAKSFYGPGMTVNTNSKFTVVTQVRYFMDHLYKPVSYCFIVHR